MPHLAPTYAAVNALMTVGTPEAYALIDPEGLTQWMCSLRKPDGSFLMHEDGEVDVR